MNDKMKNLCIRTISGIVLLLVLLGALLWSMWSAAALFGVIMVGGLIEFYRLCKARGYAPMNAIGVATSLAIFGLSVVMLSLMEKNLQAGETTSRIVFGFILYIMLIVPSIFVSELWRKSETPIANMATTLMGVIYVAPPMALLLFIPRLLVGEWSAWAMLAYIGIIWANDVFAYLVGVAIGKHRLCERISPKKSWEGFLGGLVGAVAAAVLFGYLLKGDLLVWGGLGLVAALTGVAGDFVESLIKREAEVKDSGSIMPGHGGFLDRFDALFLSVPFAFVYLLLASLL